MNMMPKAQLTDYKHNDLKHKFYKCSVLIHFMFGVDTVF